VVDLTGFRRSQGVTLQPITFAVLVFSLIVLRVSAVEDEFGLDAEPARSAIYPSRKVP
jgi:hypothetical protein